MATELAAAPVLSTPDDHILEAPGAEKTKTIPASTLSDEELRWTYEIARTAREIRQGGWKKIALQFPDDMLVDAPRVVQTLGAELAAADGDDESRRIHILADTSYSACCVDEIAAEHADSDVVVHYGRTCLSPTSRLPVIHVYTSHRLNHGAVVEEFEAEFADRDAKVVVMADLTYQDHVDDIVNDLRAAGYTNVVGTAVERNPAALIPNRRIDEGPGMGMGMGMGMADEEIRSHSLFHISDPPTALLLALQTRFASLHVLSTADSSAPTIDNPTARAAGLLRRRFARVLSLAAAGVVGILVNTLSVSNYLASIDVLRDKMSRAGKKSYTVVVGKLNPAKLANFAEMEGWVVVGCWESGLVEDDAGYWRPVITPFEMEVALTSEEERTWGGEWWGGIEKLTREADADADADADTREADSQPPRDEGDAAAAEGEGGGVQGEESLPPQFDLRTGRLVSHSRPMRLTTARSAGAADEKKEDGPEESTTGGCSGAVARRVAGDLVSINGVASPGAEYLRSKRTWQGLGSDFDQDASTLIEEGRSGVARGYRVGEDSTRH
ncbi:Diphthamide biosynthesis protein 1 [Epichloe bromicola]|uniref:2-(3-amino-3-carboxypropyl)histidine synthase subunit 2 n=1 Tax=Epichloe bromicola TaxID=79588 RepID=A0ABQ0CVV8_9HYPO